MKLTELREYGSIFHTVFFEPLLRSVVELRENAELRVSLRKKILSHKATQCTETQMRFMPLTRAISSVHGSYSVGLQPTLLQP